MAVLLPAVVNIHLLKSVMYVLNDKFSLSNVLNEGHERLDVDVQVLYLLMGSNDAIRRRVDEPREENGSVIGVRLRIV